MVKDPPANAGDIRDLALIPGSGRSPGRGNDSPLQYSCLENPHGQRSLAGYSPWGRKQLDMTTTTTFDLQQVIPKTTLAGSHPITLSGRDLLVHQLSVGAWLCLQAAQGCGCRPHMQGEEGRWHMLTSPVLRPRGAQSLGEGPNSPSAPSSVTSCAMQDAQLNVNCR